MPSTFLGLNIAYTGLIAANASINTTANNVANEETLGYSRQTVTQQASDAIRSYTTYGCIGSGVDTLSIDRNRDAFYDFKYWNNNNKVGEYQEKYYYMKQIEDLFTDDKTIKGFNTVFNELSAALAELEKDGGDTTKREQFIGFANNLTYYFNSVAESLKNIQIDANLEIQNKVSEINSYAQEIASLNEQINVIEMTGAKANELRDRRDLLIDKLSQITNVEVSETPVYDTNNPDRTTGINRYVVKIAGGHILVNGNDYNELECIARANYESINQSDALGLFDIVWKNGNEFNMGSLQIGGQLQGLIEIRDGNNAENFKGTVSSVRTVQKEVDGRTQNISEVTVDVTASYLKDLNKCTLSPLGGLLQIGNQEFYYDSFRFVYDENGEISSYIFEISNEPGKNEFQPATDRIGKEASVGNTIDYQGIPYYQEQINEWVRTYARAFNDILTQEDAVDGYGEMADILFVANEKTGDTQRKFLDAGTWPKPVLDANGQQEQDADGNPLYEYELSCTGDSYFYMTGANFAVSREMLDDAQLLATHTKKAAGQDKYDVVEDLIALRTNKDKMSFRSCDAGEFLQCVLADITLNTSAAKDNYERNENIARTIDTQRLSISGVDVDEESLNLVHFQHAYNLASRVIQTLSEMYDRLILQTGV